MVKAPLRAWKLQGSLQDKAAHWGLRWLRLCWKTAQRVSHSICPQKEMGFYCLFKLGIYYRFTTRDTNWERPKLRPTVIFFYRVFIMLWAHDKKSIFCQNGCHLYYHRFFFFVHSAVMQTYYNFNISMPLLLDTYILFWISEFLSSLTPTI